MRDHQGNDGVVTAELHLEPAGGPHLKSTGAPVQRPSEGSWRARRPEGEEERGPSWDGLHVAALVILFLLVVLAASFNGGCAAPEIKASKVALQGAGGGVSAEVAGPLDREQAIEALRGAAKPWAPCAEYEVQLAEVSARAVPAKGESEATVLTSVRGWFTCTR